MSKRYTSSLPLPLHNCVLGLLYLSTAKWPITDTTQKKEHNKIVNEHKNNNK
jgi:hypothetical protein